MKISVPEKLFCFNIYNEEEDVNWKADAHV